MGNTYFRFKQFIVHQEKCAIKVCTDACVLGAYISSKEKYFSNDETSILDIGTGTGLLSLMIAQKVKGNIDAVEIDEKAYEQAQENFKNSEWQTRLSVSHADIMQFDFNKKYNLIVSNPPFFAESLKSSSKQKNLAKHTTSLPYSALAVIVYNNLINNGKFYILLPCKEFNIFEKTALKNRLSLLEKLNIRQNEDSDYFRTIGVFSNETYPTETEQLLTIKDKTDTYTENFSKLLKDYYLYL